MRGSMSYRNGRGLWPGAIALGGLMMATAVVAAAQANPSKPRGAMTSAQKIANAMSAAPTSISSKATIMDWPASDGAKPALLKQGSNGWVCYPDFPATDGNDPMCLDDAWQAWMHAYMSKTAPQIARTGVGYMIAPGGASGSNTDPYATKAAPGNEWGWDAPHIMILSPNADALKGLPTDRNSGAPFVMWSGTPYAHIMAPVASMSAPAMKAPAATKKP